MRTEEKSMQTGRVIQDAIKLATALVRLAEGLQKVGERRPPEDWHSKAQAVVQRANGAVAAMTRVGERVDAERSAVEAARSKATAASASAPAPAEGGSSPNLPDIQTALAAENETEAAIQAALDAAETAESAAQQLVSLTKETVEMVAWVDAAQATAEAAARCCDAFYGVAAKAAVEDLRARFARRSKFLEACYRTGVPVSVEDKADADVKLDELQRKPDWRETLVESLRCLDSAWKLSKGYEAGSLPVFDGDGRHEDHPITRFLRQHLVYLYVLVPLDPGHVQHRKPRLLAKAWMDWAKQELLAYYDAAVLESLAAANLTGRAVFDSFLRSRDTIRLRREDALTGVLKRFLEVAYPRIDRPGPGADADPLKEGRDRASMGVTERIDQLGIDSLLSSIEGTALFSNDAPSAASIWNFVKNWDRVITAVDELFEDGPRLAEWFTRLTAELEKVREDDRKHTGEAGDDEEFDRPTGRSSWFYDPQAVLRVVNAAERLRRAGPNAQIDLGDFHIVDDARRRFIAGELEKWHKKRLRVAFPASRMPRSEQRYEYERRLEDAWWTALAGGDRGSQVISDYRPLRGSFRTWSAIEHRVIRDVERSLAPYAKASPDVEEKWEIPSYLRESISKALKDLNNAQAHRRTELSAVNKLISELDGFDVDSNFLPEGLRGLRERLAAVVNNERRRPLADGSSPGTGGRGSPGRGPRAGLPVATVFGAGIAGLTAAHELAARGFRVVVVEPATRERGAVQVGGLARSQWCFVDPERFRRPPEERVIRRVEVSSERDPNAKVRIPGEHGYRFFPSFYRHLFDTMKRTPLLPARPDSPQALGHFPTAFDQLEPTQQQVFARRKRSVPLSRARPRTLEAFRQEYMQLVEGLGFERRDLARFFFKLVRFLMTCSARRAAEYENMTFLEFLGGPEFYTEHFLQAIKAAPQALVAMDVEHCDARTQGNVYLQLLMDQVLGGEYVDGILRGPTSAAWLELWQRYLETLDVEFLSGTLLSLQEYPDVDSGEARRPELDVILEIPLSEDQDEEGKARTLELLDRVAESHYYVVALDAPAAERVTAEWDIHGVPSELRGFASRVERTVSRGLYRYEAVARLEPRYRSRTAAQGVLQGLLSRIKPEEDEQSPGRVSSILRSLHAVTGEVRMNGRVAEDVRIFLWFPSKVGPRQIKRLERALVGLREPGIGEPRLLSDEGQRVNAPGLIHTPRLPEHQYGVDPRDRFQTFTGIQYYFAQDFKLVRGHVYFPDTDWGLSSVSQNQFWYDEDLRRNDIRGILSIDIGDCRKKSSFTGKSFFESSPQEIAAEVWRQVTDSLRTTRGPASVVTSLPLPEPVYYHLDDNLRFIGGRFRDNLTPFLINNAGDWKNRPRCMPWVPGSSKLVDDPATDGPNVWQAPHGGYRIHDVDPTSNWGKVVFCGHYMRTFTRMTTMEAANESARHAVNAILDHMAHRRWGSDGKTTPIPGDYCTIWDIEQHELDDLAFFKRVDEMLFKAGKPHIADILKFDEIADLQHPELTSGQALMTALGVTLGKDWGVQPGEVVAAVNGLVDAGRKLLEALGASTGTPYHSSVSRLLSLLGRGGGRGSSGEAK